MPSVKQTLDFRSVLRGARRIAVVGIGSDLRGDDAAGVEVIRKLRQRLKSTRVLLIEGGVAPESFTAEIRRFMPSHILLVDATDFGAKPGEVILAEPEAITGRSISTHTMPLSLLASYLREQTGAKVSLLGIQPASAEMGAPMSEQVKKAVDGVVTALSKLGSPQRT